MFKNNWHWNINILEHFVKLCKFVRRYFFISSRSSTYVSCIIRPRSSYLRWMLSTKKEDCFMTFKVIKFLICFQENAYNKLSFAKGVSINTPPMFGRVHYQFWKVNIKNLIEFIVKDIMNVIVNGPYIPMHKFYHCS